MKLKYQKEIDNFQCDLSSFSQQQRVALRWVFADILDSRNFLPVYLDPKREQINCKGFALSFFDKHENAKARLLHLTKDKANLFKKLGTHIALGKLEETDGISEPTNSEGHFNHFEYVDVDFNGRFEIIEKVAP